MSGSTLDKTSFIIRMQSLASGTATLTHVFGKADLEKISGAYLSLTTGGTTTSIDTKLGSTNTYLGRVIEFTSAANATSVPNVGVRRVITSYVVSTQTIGFATLPATSQIGDKYKILSPIPRGCGSIGLCSMAFSNTTALITSGANTPNIKIVDNEGNQFACLIPKMTTVTMWTGLSLAVPVLLIPGDNGVTITQVNGTAYDTATDFYVQFVAS